jgi:hypothetical protein
MVIWRLQDGLASRQKNWPGKQHKPNQVGIHVNGDGQVNLLDVQPFIGLVSLGKYSAAAGIDQDGAVNLLDVAAFVQQLSGSISLLFCVDLFINYFGCLFDFTKSFFQQWNWVRGIGV